MNARKELEDLREILEEMQKRMGTVSAKAFAEVARLVGRAIAIIEPLPPITTVRPATIALHNLRVSLRNGTQPNTLFQELEAALDAVDSLLAIPTFGLNPDDLRKDAITVLRQRGLRGCWLCGRDQWTIEIVSALVIPFPGQFTMPPPQVPSAMLVCGGCGMISHHSLSSLQLLP